ncbi:MAG: hypothetical protein KF912_03475 [Phycisphaeraceae bacterium]|nr:hypothetical protein [Phycisphaeraceae bacterium]MBX3366358.1 hypothetical protein [Phycisphaeraceae bacterium]
MRKKSAHSTRSGRRGLSVSLHPLTPDDALRAVLSIKQADAKRIIEKAKPKKK